MKTARSAVLVLAIAAAAALAGCSSGTPAESPSPATTAPPSSDSQASVFVGSWGKDGTGKPSLTIASDGGFNGTDGCNSLAGTGTINGDTFEFGTFTTTLMACEGVDTWLSQADTATVDGDTLTVLDKDGSTAGTLAKR